MLAENFSFERKLRLKFMSQLGTLVWLKWTLFRNAVRSRKGIANRVASLLGSLAALGLALLIASGLGFFAYVSVKHDGARQTMPAVTILFGIQTFIYLTWVTLPLNFGGGSAFDPGRLLLYPVSLKKLFAIDLISELTSLASIFAVPSVFALALGAGLARKNVLAALVCALCASVFGIALAKLMATLISLLTQRKRTRGESLLALIGAIGGIAGALLGPLFQRMAMGHFARHIELPDSLRWSPPGALAVALVEGLRPRGEETLALALLTLIAYTCLIVFITYRTALRIVDRGGGIVKRKQSTAGALKSVKKKDLTGNWHAPFLSTPLSAIAGKELRYALRNPQVRTLALMAPVFAVVFVFAYAGKWEQGGARSGFRFYAEGGLAGFVTLYVFMFISGLTSNIFGYDAAGMRTLVLAPIERRTILIGKNITTTTIAFALVAIGLLLSEALFDYLTAQAICFASLCFIIFAVNFALAGNWLSMRYPKRIEMGKRLARSGVAGLFIILFFLTAALAPAIAILAGYAARSLFVKYVILISFAAAGLLLYPVLITKQGQILRERELEILEAVTGRSDDDSRILG